MTNELLVDFKNCMHVEEDGYDEDCSGYLYDWARANYDEICVALKSGSDIVDQVCESYNRNEIKRAHETITKLTEALKPFVSFGMFLAAMRECDGEEPIDEKYVIMSVMGAGGSDYLYWKNFMDAKRAFAK